MLRDIFLDALEVFYPSIETISETMNLKHLDARKVYHNFWQRKGDTFYHVQEMKCNARELEFFP